MNLKIDAKERDEIMNELFEIKENRRCFDCSVKATWASSNLGIFICYDCAGRHRGYGTDISFVRSVELDQWKRKEIESMKIAGNKYAKEKFELLGVPKNESKYYDYTYYKLQKYRDEIKDKVINIVGDDSNKVNSNINTTTNSNTNSNNKNTNTNSNVIEKKEVKKEEIVIEKPKIKEATDIDFDDIDFDKSVNINNGNTNTSSNNTNTKKNKKLKTNNKAKKITKLEDDFDWDDNLDFSSNKNTTTTNTTNNKTTTTNNNNKYFDDDDDDEVDIKVNNNKNNNINTNNNNKPSYMNDSFDDDDNEIKTKINTNYSNNNSNNDIDKSKFANKKAISSEDYMNNNDDNWENKQNKQRLNQFKGATAISSNDVTGHDPDDELTFGDKVKQYAFSFGVAAHEKVKQAKEKGTDFIDRIQNKYGN